jgi:Recombination endonuclease VII
MTMRGAQPIPNAYIRCLLTTGEAAREVGVTGTTIRRALRAGHLRCGAETVSGQSFVHLGDVWHFMSQRAMQDDTMQPIEQGTTTPPPGDRQTLRDNLWRLYRVSIKTYDEAVESQDGRCAVCREFPPEGKRLQVDHDHDTGQVRGLLCAGCNAALGSMRERPDAICRLAAYADYCARLRTAKASAKPEAPS